MKIKNYRCPCCGAQIKNGQTECEFCGASLSHEKEFKNDNIKEIDLVNEFKELSEKEESTSSFGYVFMIIFGLCFMGVPLVGFIDMLSTVIIHKRPILAVLPFLIGFPIFIFVGASMVFISIKGIVKNIKAKKK